MAKREVNTAGQTIDPFPHAPLRGVTPIANPHPAVVAHQEARTVIADILAQCNKFGYRLTDDLVSRAIKVLG